ncbi:MAG: DUF2235 domain-containing protein [Chromatiales bacterium]|nr:DUF2235 domain-containing protein [Chromatiales bacterium]
MALYAFDGTWNTDADDDAEDSNVVRFKELYTRQSFYLSGVGTRMGAIGRAIGGLFGAGGHTRIREMHEALGKQWAAGDHEIDIVGFSRGAALAVHFANLIATKGIELPDGTHIDGAQAPIRFLGVWDIVGSFGLNVDTIVNFQAINLGWEIDHVERNVRHCFHAMALDERRETFGLTRLDPDNSRDFVEERWFRGVHSDIGGGNRNPDRSNIALQWMLDKAVGVGLPIDAAKRTQVKYAKIDRFAIVSENKDPQRDPRRAQQPGDSIDPSAPGLILAIGESHTTSVLAEQQYNWSGVTLERGARYHVKAEGTWKDGDLEPCDARGWKSEQLGWVKEKIVEWFEDNRREPLADWFELVGAYGDEDDELVRLGDAVDGMEFTATRDADLWLFANDLKSRYGNNAGAIDVTVTRRA